MLDKLESWNLSLINNIDFTNEILLFKINSKYLLNSEKDEFNLIEKIVYELASFHIQKLELNEKDVFIEFCIENLITKKMKIDYYKNNQIYSDEKFDISTPIISTITYLNNNNIPDILTNIDIESYNFKNINSKNIMVFSFPKFLKHISFEGGKYVYGINDILNENTERFILKINIWNKTKPDFSYYLDEILENKNKFYKNNNVIFLLEKYNNIYSITTEESIINEDVLYKNIIKLEKNIFESLLKNYNNYDFIKLEKKILNDTNLITIHSDNTLKKFLQRFVFNKFYDQFICNFIINETMTILNSTDLIQYNKYKILDIEKLPSIMNIILTSFQIIIENIEKSYCLKNNNSYNIDKIFILKNDTSTCNGFFIDNSSISVNIILNSKFEGGQIKFDDDLESNLKIGDMIIYNGKTEHTFLPITNGVQYILVGLINIYENKDI